MDIDKLIKFMVFESGRGRLSLIPLVEYLKNKYPEYNECDDLVKCLGDISVSECDDLNDIVNKINELQLELFEKKRDRIINQLLK